MQPPVNINWQLICCTVKLEPTVLFCLKTDLKQTRLNNPLWFFFTTPKIALSLCVLENRNFVLFLKNANLALILPQYRSMLNEPFWMFVKYD